MRDRDYGGSPPGHRNQSARTGGTGPARVGHSHGKNETQNTHSLRALPRVDSRKPRRARGINRGKAQCSERRTLSLEGGCPEKARFSGTSPGGPPYTARPAKRGATRRSGSTPTRAGWRLSSPPRWRHLANRPHGRYRLSCPVRFSYRGDEVAAQAATGAIRYDITLDPASGPVVPRRVVEDRPPPGPAAGRTPGRSGGRRRPQRRPPGGRGRRARRERARRPVHGAAGAGRAARRDPLRAAAGRGQPPHRRRPGTGRGPS